MVSVGAVVSSERVNAIAGWLLLGVVAVAAVVSALGDDLLWGALAVVVLAVAVVPPVLARAWTVMVPWPLLLVAAVAAVARAFGHYPEVAGYLVVSALALLAVVELTAFTDLEMTPRFGVFFAVLTTMAIQGFWMVAQFYSDRWLGTELLPSQTELQWDIVAVTAVGVVVGAAFVWYFERVEHAGTRGTWMQRSRETAESREP